MYGQIIIECNYPQEIISEEELEEKFNKLHDAIEELTKTYKSYFEITIIEK